MFIFTNLVTPGLASRQSLPGRTSVRNPDPFVIPGRSSMIGQPHRRLAKVGEDEVLGVTPWRTSLAPQTPLRVLKKSKVCMKSEKHIINLKWIGQQ